MNKPENANSYGDWVNKVCISILIPRLCCKKIYFSIYKCSNHSDFKNNYIAVNTVYLVAHFILRFYVLFTHVRSFLFVATLAYNNQNKGAKPYFKLRYHVTLSHPPPLDETDAGSHVTEVSRANVNVLPTLTKALKVTHSRHCFSESLVQPLVKLFI